MLRIRLGSAPLQSSSPSAPCSPIRTRTTRWCLKSRSCLKKVRARGGAIDSASDCSSTRRRTRPAAALVRIRDCALTSTSPCPRIAIVIAFFFFARPIFLSLAVPQTARRTTSTPPSGRESTRRPKRKGKQSRGRASQCRPPLVRRPRVDPHPIQFNICALPTDATDRCALPDRAAAVLGSQGQQ